MGNCPIMDSVFDRYWMLSHLWIDSVIYNFVFEMKRNIVEGYVKVTSDAMKWLSEKTKNLWEKAASNDKISKLNNGYLIEYDAYKEIKQEIENEDKKDPYGVQNINFSKFDYSKTSEENLRKYELQRYERGFDDSEIYDLDDTIIKFLVPRLKVFREIHDNSAPKDLTVGQWNAILDEMIEGFEDYVHSDDMVPEKYSRALELFKEHFEDLWF